VSGTIWARCPAKVNLSLKVVGRRPDGYHELETVFQAIELWDDLEAAPAPALTLSCDEPTAPGDDSNLVLRAARALRSRFPEPARGAALRLRKRIPVGGGLGGGSSDAAGTLLLLSRLWELPTTVADLASLAREIGADVAFFLHGGRALGTGRGDRIEPLRSLGPFPILLGCPPFAVSTARTFGSLAARLTLPAAGVSVGEFPALKWREENDFRYTGNDLECVVFAEHPELGAFRGALLGEGARLARMSGSGSTVFGVFGAEESLAEARAALGPRFPGWRLIATRATDAGAHVVGTASGAGRTGD